MHWQKVQIVFPDQWVIVEAVKASSKSGKRVLDELEVIESFSDSMDAMKAYGELHRTHPVRELYVLHSSRELPEIEERRWVGVRGAV